MVGYSLCSFKEKEEQLRFTRLVENKLEKASIPGDCELQSDSKCKLSAVDHSVITEKPVNVDTKSKRDQDQSEEFHYEF